MTSPRSLCDSGHTDGTTSRSARRKEQSLKCGLFDLALTLQSGQVFHACEAGGWWQILDGRRLLELRQSGDQIILRRGSLEHAGHYFSLDHPLEAIYETFPTDPYSRAARESCRGLRILRQQPWECLATFITSSMKQVAHIRLMSLAIREHFGDPVKGSLVKAYPTPSRLSALEEADLRTCGLGYRAKNLLLTARAVASEATHFEEFSQLSTSALRERLCAFPGVGRKVANCVLLFAYGRLDAVPVDVWIARIATAMHGRNLTPLKLEKFVARGFGPHAGYVQQYLFHHARTTGQLPGRTRLSRKTLTGGTSPCGTASLEDFQGMTSGSGEFAAKLSQ